MLEREVQFRHQDGTLKTPQSRVDSWCIIQPRFHVSLRGRRPQKRLGEKGTLGSFLSLPLPLSLLSLPSLSCFPSSSSPFLCLPRCPVPVRRVFHTFLVNAFRRPRDKSTCLVDYPYMSSDPTLSLTLYNRLI